MVSLLTAIRSDFKRFQQRILPPKPPTAGMSTYRFSIGDYQRRVHLRLESDGRGVLFVDVTEVIHLNPTAAEMAKWALDGTPQSVAASWLGARFGRGTRAKWRNDLVAIYEMVARFTQFDGSCPTCALSEVDRQGLFTVAIDSPYKADLALTYDCTNDCPHCYNEADRMGMEILPADQWKRMIERLAKVGVPHLIFTGGEATLHPDLPELIRYADSLGPICGLNTNGRRLAHADYAQDLLDANLNHVQVTLGSHLAEVHDRVMNARAFDQTVRGIQNALGQGLHTITNTTLMRMNADHIEDTIRFIHDLGIRTFAVNGMIYSGGGASNAQAIPEEEMSSILIGIRDLARKLGMKFLWYTPTMYCRLSPVELDIGAKRCNAGEYSLCVEPNGDVLPCQSYYTSAGNLLRDPWSQIWNGGLFRSFRDRCDDPQLHGLPEMCWECPDLPLCGGGCRIEREATEGSGDNNDGTESCSSGCSSGGCASGGCGSGGASAPAAGFVSIESLSGPIKPSDSSNSRGRKKARSTGVFSSQEKEPL